jgi:hypothetical protein
LLATVMGLTIAAAAEARAEPEAVEPPAPEIDPEPMLFLITVREPGADFWEIDPLERTMRTVPRWEALRNLAAPQPEPLAVVVTPAETPFEHARGDTVYRVWDSNTVHECRLCARCNAFPMAGVLGKHLGRPDLADQTVCWRYVPLGTTPEQAALWTEKGGDL